MFDKPGAKIKLLAVIDTVCGIIFSCIFGLFYLIQGEKNMTLGVLILLLGSFLSWVIGLFTYGFGELIEKTNKIHEHLEPDTKNDTQKHISDTAKEQRIGTHSYTCPKCQSLVYDVPCPVCGCDENIKDKK